MYKLLTYNFFHPESSSNVGAIVGGVVGGGVGVVAVAVGVVAVAVIIVAVYRKRKKIGM